MYWSSSKAKHRLICQTSIPFLSSIRKWCINNKNLLVLGSCDKFFFESHFTFFDVSVFKWGFSEFCRLKREYKFGNIHAESARLDCYRLEPDLETQSIEPRSAESIKNVLDSWVSAVCIITWIASYFSDLRVCFYKSEWELLSNHCSKTKMICNIPLPYI